MQAEPEIYQAERREAISGLFQIFSCGCHIKNRNYESSLSTLWYRKFAKSYLEVDIA